jgi:hypothetical protein
MPEFQRQTLDDYLYDRRDLVRLLCMRTTLHLVPSDEMPAFYQAYAGHQTRAELRRGAALLVQAGLCQEAAAGRRLQELHGEVLDVLAEKGACTVRQISEAVPDLSTQVRHDAGKSYEGTFSLGSRLVPGMCALGLLVRAQPRGSWRSSLYQYAALSEWLPDMDLAAVTPQEARSWLVRRYLAAFGPATFDDVQWWTGFSKGETQKTLQASRLALVEVEIEKLGSGYLMLADDAQSLHAFHEPETPGAFFLPGLDPYIMGYQDRRRFLAPTHRAKVFDRAGNALPTIWVNGRVAGAWGQRKDGSVISGMFEPVAGRERESVAAEARRLEHFLAGEFLPQRTHTAFTRTLK